MLVSWSINGMAVGIPLLMSVLSYHIISLAYAEDICLLAESIDDDQCSLHRLENSAAEISLAISHNKIKMMHLWLASIRHVHLANGDPVDSCDELEYLQRRNGSSSRLSQARAVDECE